MKAIPTWKQRKLGESLSILKDGTHGTHKNVENGPHLLSAKNIKNGKIKVTEDDRKISQKEYEQIHKNFQLKSGDILLTIVGSIGEAAVLQDPTGITFQRSVAYLRSSEIDTYFLYTLFIGPDFQKELKNRQVVSAQPGIYLGDISKIIVKIPKGMKEQKQIGKFFKQLNNAIALHQEKLSKLQSLKEAALQSLFPQKNETEPKVRFANFSSSWKQRKLGELVERVTRKNKNLDSTLPLTVSAQDGLVDQNEYFTKTVASRNVSNYYLLKKGEFAYNKSYSNGYPLGAIKRLDKYEKGVLSTLYVVFKPTYVNSDFLAKYYDSTHWYYEVYKHAAEGVRNHGLLNISPSDFFSTELKVPKSYEEQSKIGIFINKLDNSIALHQQRLEKLQNCKKVFLQKMFI